MSNVAESSNVSKACEVKDIEELMEVLDSSIGKIRILPILYDLFEKGIPIDVFKRTAYCWRREFDTLLRNILGEICRWDATFIVEESTRGIYTWDPKPKFPHSCGIKLFLTREHWMSFMRKSGLDCRISVVQARKMLHYLKRGYEKREENVQNAQMSNGIN